MRHQDKAAHARRKQEIGDRNHPIKFPSGRGRMIKPANVGYEVSSRINATAYGGAALGAQLLQSLGLPEKLDAALELLQRHRPYYESDHILSLVLATFCGARRLEDLERFRSDSAFLDAIGAERIPDPTTAGDFLRRFSEEDIGLLQEALNEVRTEVWKKLPQAQRKLALIDVDGTLVDTYGERKEGADFNYKKGFGYAPLVVSLANTKEPLYVKNRSGNCTSNDDASVEMDAAVALAKSSGFERVRLRGDRAFSLTYQFDRWHAEGTEFVFSLTTFSNIEATLEDLPEKEWKRLRRDKRKSKTKAKRARPKNTKRTCVHKREYRQLVLEQEHYREILYRPGACKRDYRLVAVRKRIKVLKGQHRLEDEIRYFLYITNVPKTELSARSVIRESNKRCDQEKLIEQLKNGVPSLTAPVNTLLANWAWMVITALPLSLKAWIGILHPCKETRNKIARMQYRRFIREFVVIPCQIVRSARRVALRILTYTPWAEALDEGLTAFKKPKRILSG